MPRPDSARLSLASLSQPLLSALMVGGITFGACLLGIYSRFDQSLSSFWIANSITLGLMLRFPHASNVAGWLCCIAAFLSADLLTGSNLFTTLSLTLLNFIGIAAIYHIYRAFPPSLLRLREPLAVLKMALACGIGVIASSLPAAFILPLLYQDQVMRAGVLWWVTEFVSYIAIFPVMLAAPKWSVFRAQWRHYLLAKELREYPLPLLGLALSGLASYVIGGPGAVAFPIPALLWCAARYSVFTTCLLTLLTSMAGLLWLTHAHPYQEAELISLRLSVALSALAPITLACVIRNHQRLLRDLQQLVDHDDLTGSHSRSAFLTQAQVLLSHSPGPVGVMMLDLDHFKAINDQYGHAAGDQVLITVTARIRNCLRQNDLLGRLGGEEFAVIVQNASTEEITRIAERIRLAIANSAISLPSERTASVTMSIGLAIYQHCDLQIEQLLALADQALYQAKEQGRNRVVLAKVKQFTP